MGRFALAFLALRFMSRRSLFRAFQIPSLILIPILFWLISKHLGDVGSLSWMKWLIFAAGFLVVGQLSFWGNYLPLVYPLHLRGTGESFSANIGGRVLGTSAAWLTFTFSAASPPSPSKIALTAAFVAGGFALLGALLTHWLPEPSKNPVA